MPGASSAQEQWPNNYAVGRRARDGALIVCEAWGRINVRALIDDTGDFEKLQLYRHEMLNLILVELSYLDRRILHGVLLVDAGGMTSEHSKILPNLEVVRVIQLR